MRYAVLISDRSENTIINCLPKNCHIYTNNKNLKICDVAIVYGDRFPQLEFAIKMKGLNPHCTIVHIHSYDSTEYNGYKYVDEYTRKSISAISDYRIDCDINKVPKNRIHLRSPKYEYEIYSGNKTYMNKVIVLYNGYNDSRETIEKKMLYDIINVFKEMGYNIKCLNAKHFSEGSYSQTRIRERFEEQIKQYEKEINCSSMIIGNSTAITLDAPISEVKSINIGWRNYNRTNCPSILYIPEPLICYKKIIKEHIKKKVDYKKHILRGNDLRRIEDWLEDMFAINDYSSYCSYSPS